MNKFNYKYFFTITLVVVWMSVIFMFSNMNSKSSCGSSLSIIRFGINSVNNITTSIGFTEKISYNDSLILAKKLNYPFRKLMHISEYLVLSVLVCYLLYLFKVKRGLGISFLFCFIYAMLDEYHQSFLDRSGQFRDVLIDSIGIIIGLIIFSEYFFKEGNGFVYRDIKRSRNNK